MTKRCKFMGFDFDIDDVTNMRYVNCVITGAVVDVEAGQSMDEGVNERLDGDVDGVQWQ